MMHWQGGLGLATISGRMGKDKTFFENRGLDEIVATIS
jgi:hypothetical protein